MQRETIATVVGKPAVASMGGAAPAFFGSTTLSLVSTRVVERTKRPIASRDSEILLKHVDSVEICSKGNPMWILLGFLTLGLMGLGLLFFILYFILKHRFLIIWSGQNAQVVAISGDEAPFRHFMEAVLSAAESARE